MKPSPGETDNAETRQGKQTCSRPYKRGQHSQQPAGWLLPPSLPPGVPEPAMNVLARPLLIYILQCGKAFFEYTHTHALPVLQDIQARKMRTCGASIIDHLQPIPHIEHAGHRRAACIQPSGQNARSSSRSTPLAGCFIDLAYPALTLKRAALNCGGYIEPLSSVLQESSE